METCLWSEFVLDHQDVMQMLMPRLLAVAARMWRPVPTSNASGEDVVPCPPQSQTLEESTVAQLRAAVAAEYEIIKPHLGL